MLLQSNTNDLVEPDIQMLDAILNATRSRTGGRVRRCHSEVAVKKGRPFLYNSTGTRAFRRYFAQVDVAFRISSDAVNVVELSQAVSAWPPKKPTTSSVPRLRICTFLLLPSGT